MSDSKPLSPLRLRIHYGGTAPTPNLQSSVQKPARTVFPSNGIQACLRASKKLDAEQWELKRKRNEAVRWLRLGQKEANRGCETRLAQQYRNGDHRVGEPVQGGSMCGEG